MKSAIQAFRPAQSAYKTRMGQGVFCRHYLGRLPYLIWLFVAVSLLAGLNSFAAAITWGKATTISNDTDVVTSGSLAYAYDDAYYATAVNGVPFGGGNSYTALGTNITLSGSYSWSNTAFGSSTGKPWDGLSFFYQTLLRGGVYAANNVPMSVTLSNLVVGHAYLVQVWVNDNRPGAGSRTETVNSSGGNAVSLDYNNTGTNGGVGQFTIGTFTADAVSQAFTMSGVFPAGGNSSQLNAIQVRDQSVAPGTNTAAITLNPGTYHQQMYGIGGNIAGGEQQAMFNAGTNLFASAFSPGGLNLSFIRLDNPYGQTEPPFAGLTNVNNTIITLFRAMQPSGRIMMTSWSPPGSLKNTGSAFKGTLATNAQGKFVYTNFANWWVNSLKYYQTNSSLPDYVSIQNEPDWYPTSGTNNAWQAGCELTAAEGTYAGYPQAFNATYTAFQSNGLGGIKLIGPDTEGISGGIIPNYLNNLTASTIGAVAHHLYGNNVSTSGAGLLSTLESQYTWWTMPKFMTEYDGDNWGTNYPDWMGLAVTMHNVFALEEANAYLVWSVYYGLLYNSNGSPATDNYYTVGHYSKFICPGDWHVDSSSSDTNVLVSLYYHSTGAGVSYRYTAVMINKAAYTTTVTLNTSNLWSTDALQRSWQVYKTANEGSANFRLTLVDSAIGTSLTNQNKSITLAPYSITTAVINSGVSSSTTSVSYAVTNNQLSLTWPGDHLGWILQAQTNSLRAGLATNWVDVANSAYLTKATFPILSANPAVFFRLRHP